MLRDLNYYAGSAREAIKNDNERDVIYQKIDEASHGVFDNPEELKALPWIQERKFVSTAPGDALNAAVRTFAARQPDIEIQPLDDSPEEYSRTEDLEQALKWEFKRMNMVGKKSPHWKIVEYAMKYCAVAIETSYLPAVYADRASEPRIQEILRSRHFRWNVHDPSNIHARESDDTLESVVSTRVLCAQELIEMFGENNPGIAEMLGGVDLKDGKALYTTMFTLYDYTDWDARVKWISNNSGSISVNRDVPTGIELMRKERTVSFLPWVFVDNKEPLLKQMIEAGLWDNVNILRTMQFSKAVDMAAHPEYWIQTPDGTLRGVTIDGTNPNQPLVTAPGINVQKLPPPTLDPQLQALGAIAESEVFRTTVAQILASVEKYAGTQNFSVVNAMLNAAIAQLSLAQMAAERAETNAMIQSLRWIRETGIPMVSFREESKGEYKKRGQEMVVRPNSFDPQYLYLKVTLNPATLADEQTKVNNAINKVERLGMSKKMAWDDLGLENFELSQSQVSEESLYQAFIQAKAQEIAMKPQLEAKAAMDAAQQGQAQPNPENAAGQSQFGNQPSQPGAPATMPGQGREQLNGEAANGQSIA